MSIVGKESPPRRRLFQLQQFPTDHRRNNRANPRWRERCGLDQSPRRDHHPLLRHNGGIRPSPLPIRLPGHANTPGWQCVAPFVSAYPRWPGGAPGAPAAGAWRRIATVFSGPEKMPKRCGPGRTRRQVAPVREVFPHECERVLRRDSQIEVVIAGHPERGIGQPDVVNHAPRDHDLRGRSDQVAPDQMLQAFRAGDNWIVTSV